MARSDEPGLTIAKIEDALEAIVDSILEQRELVIKLKTRGKAGRLDSDDGAMIGIPDTKLHTVKFPGKTAKEARKFRIIFEILKFSHEALVSGVPVTKRDIYYHQPELFGSQRIVDRYVDDLAFTLDVNRDSLNIVAAARGLVVGACEILRRDGTALHRPLQEEASLIHHTKSMRLNCDEAKWILMAEKEATFSALSKSKYWSTSLAGRGILITGKGYPDIQTRSLLRMLHLSRPELPILGLVDFDPDGLSILSAYKYGTKSLAHENPDLVVPSLQWLGMSSVDIENGDSNTRCGLLRLTERDRRKARKMLDAEIFEEGGREPGWRQELQKMLMLNMKWEIQLVNKGSGLEAWLDAKLSSACTPGIHA